MMTEGPEGVKQKDKICLIYLSLIKRGGASVCSSRRRSQLSERLRWRQRGSFLFPGLDMEVRDDTKRFIWHSWAHGQRFLDTEPIILISVSGPISMQQALCAGDWLSRGVHGKHRLCTETESNTFIVLVLWSWWEPRGHVLFRKQYQSQGIGPNDTRPERKASDLITGSFKGLKL